MKVLLCWMFVWLTGLLLPMSTRGEARLAPASLPEFVSIKFTRQRTGEVILTVANSSAEERSLISNLPRILDTLFLKFPTVACFQFRDAQGNLVERRTQQPSGWWCPYVLSSTIDIEKNKALSTLSPMVLPAHGEKSYSLVCKPILAMAAADRPDDQKQEIVEFRIKMPVNIPGEAGETAILITSEWLAVADTK